MKIMMIVHNAGQQCRWRGGHSNEVGHGHGRGRGGGMVAVKEEAVAAVKGEAMSPRPAIHSS